MFELVTKPIHIPTIQFQSNNDSKAPVGYQRKHRIALTVKDLLCITKALSIFFNDR